MTDKRPPGGEAEGEAVELHEHPKLTVIGLGVSSLYCRRNAELIDMSSARDTPMALTPPALELRLLVRSVRSKLIVVESRLKSTDSTPEERKGAAVTEPAFSLDLRLEMAVEASELDDAVAVDKDLPSEIQAFLRGSVPSIVWPFLRSQVLHLTTEMGLPPFLLPLALKGDAIIIEATDST